MSQENPTPEKSQEKHKKILLGALFVALAGVIYFQFFSGGDEAGPAVARPAGQTTATGVKPSPTPRNAPRPGATPEEIVFQPLNLASMSNKTGSGDGTGRNIFIYPPPPPPPTPKPQPTLPPPPPPPVNLYSVNPSGVIARTSEFNLTVFGDKIPQDGKVFVEGREYPSTFVSATEIRAKVPAEAIRTSGNLGVQVRSVSDAKMFSNQLSLNVAEPPAPPYRYIGLIVKKSVSIAVMKSQSDESIENVTKGSKLGTHWRILEITPQKIIIEDTNIKISHTINFTGENGS
jgi:hypothetical protein